MIQTGAILINISKKNGANHIIGINVADSFCKYIFSLGNELGSSSY